MKAEGVQRTLAVGLGETAALVVDRLVARLVGAWGPVGIVEGVAVRGADDGEDDLKFVSTVVPAPGAGWEAELEAGLAAALRRISRLDHVARLAGRGLTLHHAGEVQLILVADLGRAWVVRWLAPVARMLHQVVYDTLACDAALSGLLLLAGGEGTSQLPAEPDRFPKDLSGPDPVFDRGCFVAGLTNEAGLVVGEVEDLVSRAAHFLALLLTTPLGAALSGLEWSVGDLADWDEWPLASFGLAGARWPGEELAAPLGRRWAGAALGWLDAPAAGADQTAGAAVQRLVAAGRLSPPLLAERLAGLMPDLPGHLADETPDPPWPWLLVDMQKRLETVARGWEEAWLTARGRLRPALTEIHETSRAAVSAGLVAQAEGMAWTMAHLSAMSRLMETFIEGVEAEIEEAEADLVAIERRLSAEAASLADLVRDFPASPLEALLRWGLWPLGWLKRWAACGQAQAAARRYAHLLRGRLAALQAVWLYEAMLPFYREWLTAWQQEVGGWEEFARQISRARDLPALADWQREVERALAASGGPWTLELVEDIIQSALAADDLKPETAWRQLGPLSRWVEDHLDAGAILQRLSDYAASRLAVWLDLPTDAALARQFPDEERLSAWLAGFFAQAAPFFRYDETALAQEIRSRVRQEVWLLLPAGADSPLARLCRDWPYPVRCDTLSPGPELVAVTVRWGLPCILRTA